MSAIIKTIENLRAQGKFELMCFRGKKPTVKNGTLILDPEQTKEIVDKRVKEPNKILNAGRVALAAMLAGERPAARIVKLELGIGAYGIGQIVDPLTDPPVPADEETELKLATNPAVVYDIDPVDNVYIPSENPMCRVFTVVLDGLTNNFDVSTYKGYSEFALKIEASGGYPEVIFAKKNRKPILGDGDTIYVVKWTIFL
jgi:hypothetical protein